MHPLQFLKQGVSNGVLDLLAVTGRVEPAFAVLHLGPGVDPYDQVRHHPMSLEQFISADDYSGVRYMQNQMQEPTAWGSCLILPQYRVSYELNGRHQVQLLPTLYDATGEWNETMRKILLTGDADKTYIKSVVTMVYEYPVAVIQLERATAYYAAKHRQISGCTVQTLQLKAHRYAVGDAFEMSSEYGTEYGDVLPATLLGRNLKPTSVPVEQTQFYGQRPWVLTSNDALAILQGQLENEPLPDVTRFPAGPSRTE